MLQEIFRIPTPWGAFPIFGYGLMMVIGFLLAVQLAKFLARTKGIDPELFVNAALIALVAGIVGARLSHILENLGQFTRADRSFGENFFEAINIRSGGLTFYGGLILAFPIVVLYGVWKKVSIRTGMDIVAPTLTLGLAIGRIGCFLNGCCYGAECELPWAVKFPYYSNAYIDQYEKGEITPPRELIIMDGGKERLVTREELRDGFARRAALEDTGRTFMEKIKLDPAAGARAAEEHSRALHPAQLYSTFNSLLITAVLVAFFTMRPAPGRVMALMLILEGTTRYLLELVRAEPPVAPGAGGWFGSMSLSMILGLIIAAAGVVLWFAVGPARRDDDPVSARVAAA